MGTESFMKSEKLIGALFVTNTPKTMKVVSQLQKATRQLHSLCSHGKYHKNSQIASEIPTIRKMLEKIIVQMKALAEKNGVRAAFSVGLLKKRHIDGTEVLSEEEKNSDTDDDDVYEAPQSGKKSKTVETASTSAGKSQGSSRGSPSPDSAKIAVTTNGRRHINADDEDEQDNDEVGEGYEKEVETGEYYGMISKLQSQHDDEDEQGQEDDDLLFDSDEEPSTAHRRLKNLRPSYHLRDRMDDEDNEDDEDEDEDDLDSYGSLIDKELNNDELEGDNEDNYYNRSDDDDEEKDDDLDEGEDDDYEKYLSSKKRKMQRDKDDEEEELTAVSARNKSVKSAAFDEDSILFEPEPVGFTSHHLDNNADDMSPDSHSDNDNIVHMRERILEERATY